MSNVKAFHMSRRTASVRDAALNLARLQGEAALAYWKETARELLCAALRHGCGEEEGRDEVRRFFGAVQAELRTFQVNAHHCDTAGGSAA